MGSTPSPSTLALLVAALASGACLPDFDVLRDGLDADEVVDGDADADADTDVDADADADGGGECELPVLLAAVEGYDPTPSRVVRFSLASGTPARCADLTVRSGGVRYLRAVAWVPAAGSGGAVGVAADSELSMIDPRSGRTLWHQPVDAGTNLVPVDLFALQSHADEPLVAAALYNNSTSDVRELRTWDAADGTPRADYRWAGQGPGYPFQMGNRSVTASPLAATEIMSFREHDPGYAASSVDPFTLVRREPPYAPYPSSRLLRTIYSFYWNNLHRTAWVEGLGEDNGAMYLYESEGRAGQSPSGPVRCSDRRCELVHVVPDPTLNTRLFAVCDGPGDGYSVVRFTSTGGQVCETLVHTADLGPASGSRVWRLAIGLPAGD